MARSGRSFPIQPHVKHAYLPAPVHATGSLAIRRPAFNGAQSLHISGGLAIKRPAFHGTSVETFVSTASFEIPRPAFSALGTVQIPFPPGPLGLLFEIMVGAEWTDVTEFVYQRQPVTITRGRPDETQATSPASLSFQLDNRDGRFSPRNPLSPYYGLIGRNTQVRVSAPTTGTAPWVRGYRFWGEISEWPPSWDVTGNDVYVTISAAGILRRLSQSAALGSAMTRYYASLSGSAVPFAYWPCEDGSAATSLASGIPSGFAMNFDGNPQLSSDSGFASALSLPVMNGATFTGPTGAAGSLPVANIATFSSSGTWTAPAGINSVLAEAWGAGGGGSGFNGATGGAGGGGGEYAAGSIAVTPGNTYTVTVGTSSAGANGGSSVFTGDASANVTAHGGSKGATNGATGGAGGTGSVNTTHHNGGAGAAGSGGAGGSGSSSSGTSSQTFTSSGTWVAPSDLVGNASVYLWSGGGGGGAGSGTHGGAGAGGGGFRFVSTAVTPGNSYSVTIGAAGTGGTASTNSTDGGNTVFNGTFSVPGGGRGTTGTAGNGGEGASHVGGFGNTSATTVGGGGGGCASYGGNGQDGAGGGAGGGGGNGGASGGTDTTGGSGGNGGTSGSKAGKAGSIPGGGGGGGFGTTNNGGNGARGKAEIFWSFSDPGPTPDAAVGGGGGSSGGSGSAGSNGDTEAGGAAVTGGGPGGGTLAGSSFNASPASTPGGGGGGYDSLGSAAAGAKGSVRLTFAQSGTGSPGVAANILRFLLHLPAESTTDGAVIARMFTTGSVAWIDVVYHTGGTLTFIGFGPAGSTLFTAGPVSFNADGRFMLVSAEMVANSGNIDYALTALIAGQDAAAGSASGTLTSATLGDPWSVVMNPSGTLTDTAFGHVAVLETVSPVTDLITPVAAHAGETAADRFERLCTELNVPVTIVGTNSDTEMMGPQLPLELVALLQECEDADRGLMYESKDQFGLAYRTRADLYNQDPAITLIYTNQDLADNLQPTEDDAHTRNDVTATRPNGSSAEVILSSGALSIQDPPAGVGAYTFSQAVNVQADGQLPDLASWMLLVGTVDEPRYPQVNLDLIRTELQDNFSDITSADIGDFLTIQNPPSWLPPGPINQLVYGYTETLNAFTWTLAMNCVPESPYEVAEAGNDSRADTDGATLHDAIGTGDTTFNVTSPSPNAVWVDSSGFPAEFPFDVIIAGEQMTVTEIDGTTSPQMFTVSRQVNGISKAHNAGESVSLAHPAIIAL